MSDITVDVDTFPAMLPGQDLHRTILAGMIAVIGGLVIVGLAARGADRPGIVPDHTAHYHLPTNLPVPGASIHVRATVSGTNILIFPPAGRRDRR
jgi:hypothetical protein